MRLVDGQFKVQDFALTDLAEKYGTPLFVYDADKIEAQYHKMKDAFQVKNLRIN